MRETVSDAVGWGIVGYGWVARDYMAPGIRAAGHRLVDGARAGRLRRAAGQACRRGAPDPGQDVGGDAGVGRIAVVQRRQRPARARAQRADETATASVRAGSTQRIWLPSFDGFAPRFGMSRIACSNTPWVEG